MARARLRGRALRPLISLVLIFVVGCAPARHYEAVLVLHDLATNAPDTRLKRTTPEPLRQPVSYTVGGRTHQGDLYLPAPLAGCEREPVPRCPRAALVAVPGAVPRGKDDPRLVAFATTLARAGFAVLAPDIAGYRQLRIRPTDAEEIADAFDWISGQPQLAPEGRAGLFAFSYAVGPTVLAALDEAVRDRVRFIVGVGGYHDLPRAMRFFTTGWFEHAGHWQHLPPDDTGKLVLVYSSLDYVSAPDRNVLKRMVTLRSENRDADLAPLAEALDEAGRSVYALAVNTDPARFPDHYARLPQAMRDDIGQLDLAKQDLTALKARLLLVHGRNDNLIPWPESVALGEAVPAGQARVFLIGSALGHVDLGIASVFSWRFWREDLPDLVRLWRVVDLVLAERERE